MDLKGHCCVAFVLRLLLIVWGCAQDAWSELPYTDVDYRVFCDAALHLWRGESPFLRPTYRYTPLVAALLVPTVWAPLWGKVLFSACDVAAALLIRSIVAHGTQSRYSPDTCALWWLYCPLPAVLATRGSSESLVTLLVLLCVRLVERRPGLAGLVFGFAVHFKIYPCIYAASLYFALTPGYESGAASVRRLVLPDWRKASFALGSAAGLLAPTLGSWWACGGAYVREAWLHHVTRRDIRHNFSPFHYPLYLLEGGDPPPPLLAALVPYAGFVLQAALVLGCSLRVRPLPAALFLSTWLFVSLNKVCTSQYFAWSLCLLPMAWPARWAGRTRGAAALGAWAVAQGAWLAAAHALEFQGRHAFPLLAAASLLLFATHALLAALYARALRGDIPKQKTL